MEISEESRIFFKSLKVQFFTSSPELARTPRVSGGLNPELLIACYLSWALGKIMSWLGEVYPGNVALNLAAPMNHIEDKELKESYLRIIQGAWSPSVGKNRSISSRGQARAKK